MQRRTARENSFILIFERIFNENEPAEEIFANATELRGLEYDDYVKKVFFGSCENKEVINSAVEKHLTGWKKDRISPVSTAIIRLAAYEMMFMEDVPAKVSINEAIELSKKYDDEKTYSFVNGVLNSLASEYAKK